jgi:hypothetical protein
VDVTLFSLYRGFGLLTDSDGAEQCKPNWSTYSAPIDFRVTGLRFLTRQETAWRTGRSLLATVAVHGLHVRGLSRYLGKPVVGARKRRAALFSYDRDPDMVLDHSCVDELHESMTD